MTAENNSTILDDTQTDKDKMGFLLGYINHALEQQEEKINRAGLNRDFRRGHQWDKSEWDAYKSKGVNPITVNHILPITNAISGLQRQNKQDIKIAPRKGGTSAVAGVLTELTKHTLDMCDGQDIMSQSFLHGIATVEDYMKINIDKTNTPNGSIYLTRHSCFDVLPDPDAKEYDLNVSAKFIIHRYWQDRLELAALYPDFANAQELLSGTDANNEQLMNYFYGEDFNNGEDSDSLRKYRALIFEVWWKQKDKEVVWIDKEQLTTKSLTNDRDIKQAEKSVKYMPERFEVHKRVKSTLHKSVICANKLLEDVENPLGKDIDIFPFVRFAPYWDDGYAFGVIDNLIDPQREENINRTQAARLLNQTTNAGWIIKKAINKAKKKLLEMFGAVPGIVLETDDYGGQLERISPKPLSTGHVALAERSITDLKEISSANDALQGYGDKVESGRAIELKRRQGVMALEPIMDNFDWSVRLVGKCIITLIRKLDIYTPEEIRLVIDESNLIDAEAMEAAEQKFRLRPLPPYNPPPPDPAKMAMLNPLDQMKVKRQFEQAAMRSKAEIQKFSLIMRNYDKLIRREAQEILFQKLKSDQIGDYGVVVTLSPEAPTIMYANMIELAEIAKSYPGQLPITTYIKNSSLTNKEQIISDINQQQQKMAQAAMAARQAKMQGAVA
jgi:hypothetical protein